ncbi:MAG TPA: response regulator transcription factor [Chitinophagaceae bacterium]|nr:response regulator transcription factor [Chitinophagaceae bacterium]
MQNIYRILLAEDEVKLGIVIQQQLVKQGYEVDLAVDGLMAEKLFKQNSYNLLLLDINLPHKSGIELCKIFRHTNKDVPIIMLTALDQIKDKVAAFNFGADDYIVKPFHFDELYARIKVFLKRTESNFEKLTVANLEIDVETKQVTRGTQNIVLTSKEFKLLVLLVRAKGKIVSKQEILEKVWDLTFDTGTNTIEVYISFLRNKVDKGFETKLIQTKQGFGYFIKESTI